MSSKFSDQKNDILAPEEVQLDVRYAISINPSDHHQFWGKGCLYREECFYENIIRLMNLILRPVRCEYKFWIEYSRHGRLHLHGFISFPDDFENRDHFKNEGIRCFYGYALHRLEKMATVCLKHQIDAETGEYIAVGNWQNWFCYCTKQKVVQKRYRKFDHNSFVDIDDEIKNISKDVVKMIMLE